LIDSTVKLPILTAKYQFGCDGKSIKARNKVPNTLCEKRFNNVCIIDRKKVTQQKKHHFTYNLELAPAEVIAAN
jgi:hypothetical protein